MGLIEDIAKVYCRFSSARSNLRDSGFPKSVPIQCTILTIIKYEHWVFCFLLDRLESEETWIQNDELVEETHYRLTGSHCACGQDDIHK